MPTPSLLQRLKKRKFVPWAYKGLGEMCPTRRAGLRLPLVLLLVAVGCGEGADARGGAGHPGIIAGLELEAQYPEPFGFLNTVREMPDGTLLAADPLSQVLLRLDLASGTADTLGAVGGGPGEYEQPDQVFPIPGDSTLLVDLGKAVLTIVGPDGALHAGMPMARQTETGRLNVIMPRQVDAQGRLYFTGTGGFGQGPPDSTALVRYDRALDQLDTVAMMWRPEIQMTGSGGNVRMLNRMMEAMDDWAVGPDGSIAVARANGYSVDWYHPDGSVVSGPPTSFETIPIGDPDKEAVLEEITSSSVTMMMTASQGGATNMSMRRGFGIGGDRPNREDFEWAETFPPFRPQRTRVGPGRTLWVESFLPRDAQPRMEIFGPDGIRQGFVEMPINSQIIGFGRTADGADAAYLVRIDEVGLKWLSRHKVVRQ